MNGSNRLAGLVFWFMVLAGAAIVAPCVILPAWLEYQASLELRALWEQQVADRQAAVVKLRKQRQHLETDEAYVLRLAQEQFNIEIPGVERVPVEPGTLPASDTPPAAPAGASDELVPELSAKVDEILRRHPLAGMFVWPQTRPSLLLIGGGLVLMAIFLLGASPAPNPQSDET